MAFYKQFNIKRIVLDRQLKINEIKNIILSHPDMNFEIFLMFGNCLFIDGFCSFMHSLETHEKNKKFFFNTSNLLSHCGFIHKLQFEDKYKVINMSKRKYKIKFNKKIKNLSTGCNFCAPKSLKNFSNHLIYKIVSRGNIFINEFNIVEPFLNNIAELESNHNENTKNLFKKIFNYDCNGYGCYASKKII